MFLLIKFKTCNLVRKIFNSYCKLFLNVNLLNVFKISIQNIISIEIFTLKIKFPVEYADRVAALLEIYR